MYLYTENRRLFPAVFYAIPQTDSNGQNKKESL